MSGHLLSCPHYVSPAEAAAGIEYPGECTCHDPSLPDTRTLNLFETPAVAGERRPMSDETKDEKKYASIEDAILGELRRASADGLKHEKLRWAVSATVDGFTEEDYDNYLGELRDRGVVVEAPGDAGRVVLAEVVRGGAETTEDEAAPAHAEPAPLDPLPVLAALQLLGDAGGSVEDLQREIEASGSGRHPRGVIWAIAASLADQGKVRMTGVGEEDSRFWLPVAEPAETVIDRRALLLLTVYRGRADGGFVLGDLISDAGLEEEEDRAKLDVKALVAAGQLSPEDTDGTIFYGVSEEQSEELARLGAFALAARTVDVPPPVQDRSKFEIEAVERLERERADRLKAEAKLDRLCGWMEKKGLDPDVILEPESEPDPTTHETFEFKESRPVDDAERGRMFEERVKLDEKKALARAKLDAAKAAYKAEEEVIDGEVEELVQASKCNSRIVVIPARKVPDWQEKVFRIVAVDDGRELGTEPMPRGTQRLIPGTEPGAEAAAATEANATPAVKAAVDAFVDGMAAKGIKVSASRGADGVPVIKLDHNEDRAHAPELVDMAKLTKWQAQVYEALKARNEPVLVADLAAAVQGVTGKAVGPAASKFIEGAAEELVTTGVVVKENGAFRVLGAARKKSAPKKTARERLWAAVTEVPKTKAELCAEAGVTADEADTELDGWKKSGKVVTSGKARGTKYARAGVAGQTEAQV